MKLGFIRACNFLLVPIYMFAVLIPIYYSWSASAPAQSFVNVTSGVFGLARAGKSGYIVSIDNQDGRHYFTCRGGLFGGYQSCPIPNHGIELVGKEVSLSWFEQPIYIFITQKRILSISSNGREVLPFSAVIEKMNQRRKMDPYFAAGLFAFFVWTAVFFERYAITRRS